MTAAPPRPSMTKARRVRIFIKEEGRCYLCRDKIKIGELFEVEHVIPWALSQDDSDDNLKVAHTICHRQLKTGDDVKRIAKAKRQGRETGQQARRAVKGGSIPSRSFPKTKTTWPKRPFKRGDT
jgi:CRISPR/Cas system Type II protein with McrA/HNH and RuvC-like nuclease domain